ncbi:MAG: prepilin peptidase [Candidatus Micrarchaeia archaeon]
MLEFFNAPSSVPGIEPRIIVALAFTAAAAYYDIFNKKWVPNLLLYSFVAAAILLNIVYFEQGLFMQAAVFGIAAFIISYPLYKAGQLGGADVFCYASIAMAIPYLPSPILNPTAAAPYPFILSALVPTGLAFIAHMALRFVPYVFSQMKKGRVRLSMGRLAVPALISAAFMVFAYAVSTLPLSLPAGYFVLLSFLFASLMFFSLFKTEIKDSMVESVPVSKLQEEDVLALEKMDSKLVSRLNLQPLISAKIILALKKAKLKAVPVYTNMPFFLPYLLFGLVFTLLFGDLISYFVPSAGTYSA